MGLVADNIVLGVKWYAGNDELSVTIKEVDTKNARTKRFILSVIASIWDPLGMCAAFVLMGRLIFQSVVRLKLGWDETIQDPQLQKRWNHWLSQVNECEKIVVGRNVFPSKPLENCCLVGFSDGTSCGVVYLRWFNDTETEVEVKFIAAKGKVGAINGNTVPRMELCGGLTLARLMHSAKTTLGDLCQRSLLCTDSSTVLTWINSEAIKYRPYVKNKIIEIQDLHPVREWRYVPGNKNKAADMISKGCEAKDLNIIIIGPEILKIPFSEWPNLQKDADVTDE